MVMVALIWLMLTMACVLTEAPAPTETAIAPTAEVLPTRTAAVTELPTAIVTATTLPKTLMLVSNLSFASAGLTYDTQIWRESVDQYGKKLIRTQSGSLCILQPDYKMIKSSDGLSQLPLAELDGGVIYEYLESDNKEVQIHEIYYQPKIVAGKKVDSQMIGFVYHATSPIGKWGDCRTLVRTVLKTIVVK